MKWHALTAMAISGRNIDNSDDAVGGTFTTRQKEGFYSDSAVAKRESGGGHDTSN